MNLDDLIKKGEELSVPWADELARKVWTLSCERFIEGEFGEDFKATFQSTAYVMAYTFDMDASTEETKVHCDAVNFLKALRDQSSQISPSKKISPSAATDIDDFISHSILVEFEQIKSKDFDTKILQQLCVEINFAYSSASYISILLLIRTILNHVPPIFSARTFTEVVSNLPKSDKEIIANLEDLSRKLADKHAHSMISTKEILPTKNQVIPFRSSIEVLLHIIIKRLTKD